MNAFWDSPMVSGVAFVPRACPNPCRNSTFARDGTFPVGDSVQLGYTFYPRDNARAVVLYFHANAEVVSDLDGFVGEWTRQGVAMLAFDYRGYGWSTGQPTISSLMGDCEKIIAGLPALLSELGVSGKPVFVFGRSIGACAAVHAVHFASTKTEGAGLTISGLILDSGLMELKSLPVVQSMSNIIPNGAQILSMFPDPMSSFDKLPSITCPALVMHSVQDEVVPFAQAQECHRRLTCRQKQLKAFTNSGHNDVISKHLAEYFQLVNAFITQGLLPPLGDVTELSKLGVKELKRMVEAYGLSAAGCLEKADLLAKLAPLAGGSSS